MREQKKKFAKYPSIFGKYNLKELIEVARKNGMTIITARKPGMHVCAEIGLYGTKAQMEKTEKQWNKAGNEIERFNRGKHFEVNLKIPKTEWVDSEPILST